MGLQVRRIVKGLDLACREVAPEAMEQLRGYPWPGKIRELQSVLKQTLLRVSGPVVTAESLPEPVSAHATQPRAQAIAPVSGSGRSAIESVLRQELQDCSEDLYQHVHRQVDQHLLPLVLQSTGGNQLRAAQLLGITRRTLRLNLRELGLSVTKTVEPVEDDDDWIALGAHAPFMHDGSAAAPAPPRPNGPRLTRLVPARPRVPSRRRPQPGPPRCRR